MGSVNRPTSHRPFRDLTRENMKLFVAAPPASLSTLAKLVLAKGALAAGVGAYGLYDWVTRGTNAGFKAGVGVGPVSLDAAAGFGIGPANLGAGGEPVSKVDEEIPVVWLTDDEWETQEW